MSDTEYDELWADSKKIADVDLNEYLECTAEGQLALRPGKEKALHQVSREPTVYRQERLMAGTMERLTTASLQVMANIPGFLSTLGRWLRSSAGYIHREGQSPLDIIAIKVATRLDLSQFEKVPAVFRTSLTSMSKSSLVHPWMRSAAVALVAQLPEVRQKAVQPKAQRWALYASYVSFSVSISLCKSVTVYRVIVCRQLQKHPTALQTGAGPGICMARNSSADSKNSTSVNQSMVSLVNR